MTNFLAWIINIDSNIGQLILSWRTENLSYFFNVLTWFGSSTAVIFLFVLAILILRYYRKNLVIISFFLTILGSALTTGLIKFLVHRSRPSDQIAIHTEDSYSFPSGHATISVAFWGFLIYILWCSEFSQAVKIIITTLLTIFILAIGFSRVYLGVHFLSDVLAGYLVGLFWVLLSIYLIKKRA